MLPFPIYFWRRFFLALSFSLSAHYITQSGGEAEPGVLRSRIGFTVAQDAVMFMWMPAMCLWLIVRAVKI
jgi:hypothetical protein